MMDAMASERGAPGASGLGSDQPVTVREAVEKMVQAGMLDDLMNQVESGDLQLTGDGGFLPELGPPGAGGRPGGGADRSSGLVRHEALGDLAAVEDRRLRPVVAPCARRPGRSPFGCSSCCSGTTKGSNGRRSWTCSTFDTKEKALRGNLRGHTGTHSTRASRSDNWTCEAQHRRHRVPQRRPRRPTAGVVLPVPAAPGSWPSTGR